MSYAPVALFAYKRPRHVRKVVEALLTNEEASQTELFVFSDAAKSRAARAAVTEVRAYIRQISGFSAVHVIERDENYGLARSIIEGVSAVCGQFGRVIVVEDDILTSRYFLRFMNDGLEMYQHDEKVISVHGYVYPTRNPLPETFFLKGADCWGWATWQRGWDIFEPDGAVLLQQLQQRGLTHCFDCDGSYPYTRMLEDQFAGKNDSWAVRWHASAFLRDRLTLYPGRSLVLNIGNDNSGTHSASTTDFSGGLAEQPVRVARLPLEESEPARQEFIDFYRTLRPSILNRILRSTASMVGIAK
jgi:hypothetical protein